VSNDTYCSGQLSSLLTALGVKVTTAENLHSACDHLDGKHFDIVIVDCDDTYRGLEALKHAHLGRSNRSSTLIAILNGTTATADAQDQGAEEVFSKPLSIDSFRERLSSLVMRSRGEMRGHRRVTVNIPGYASFGTVFDRLIELTTVSEGGLGFKTAEPLSDGELMTVRFSLPGAPEMRVRAELAWSDSSGAGGMKMVSVQPADVEILKSWIVQAGSRAQEATAGH
jgi:CheY-like chemotaxis protein